MAESSMQNNVSFKEPINIVIEQKEKKLDAGKSIWERPAFLDMLKWIGGTLILGIAGIIINIMTGNTDRELKKFEIDSKEILQYINGSSGQKPEDQIKFLERIENLMLSDAGKDYILKQIAKLEKDKQTDSTAIVVSEKTVTTGQQTQAMNADQRDRLLTIAKNVPAKGSEQIAIDTFKKETAAILINDTATYDVAAIQKIEAAKELITPKTNEDYTIVGTPETKWCKEGYYVEYNKTLRLGINTLNNGSIEFNLKSIENGIEKIEDGKRYLLFSGKSVSIVYNNYKYVISLDYIGRAGKNPFTNAAYITVTTYKK